MINPKIPVIYTNSQLPRAGPCQYICSCLTITALVIFIGTIIYFIVSYSSNKLPSINSSNFYNGIVTVQSCSFQFTPSGCDCWDFTSWSTVPYGECINSIPGCSGTSIIFNDKVTTFNSSNCNLNQPHVTTDFKALCIFTPNCYQLDTPCGPTYYNYKHNKFGIPFVISSFIFLVICSAVLGLIIYSNRKVMK